MTRYYSRLLAIAFIALASVLSLGTGGAPRPTVGLQQPASAFKAPDNIDFRSANNMSEGVPFHAELFSLKSLAGKQLPTVIMAHGWGGTAAHFRRDAVDPAGARYVLIHLRSPG